LLTTLLASPVHLAIAIGAAALLNHALVVVALRDESRQHMVERAGASSTARRPAVELVQRFGMPAVIIWLSFFIDGASREALAGGWLVMQIAAIAMNIDGILRMRAHLRPGLVEGRLVVSKEYQDRSAAARSVGMAAFCGLVALLFWSLAFAAASVYLLATAVGWYRRAHQSAERTPR
jgi:hypothetical protein